MSKETVADPGFAKGGMASARSASLNGVQAPLNLREHMALYKS